ncbi:MAG: hypothetical protein ACJ73S_25190 [Mycobacteriales bacterium]
MADVMIRVDERTRELISRLAEQDHSTLGQEVARLAEREIMLREFRTGYERLMADPEAWADYVRERDEWLDADLTGVDGAPDEYPEYRR